MHPSVDPRHVSTHKVATVTNRVSLRLVKNDSEGDLMAEMRSISRRDPTH
jgi:hypothetical protein